MDSQGRGRRAGARGALRAAGRGNRRGLRPANLGGRDARGTGVLPCGSEPNAGRAGRREGDVARKSAGPRAGDRGRAPSAPHEVAGNVCPRSVGCRRARRRRRARVRAPRRELLPPRQGEPGAGDRARLLARRRPLRDRGRRRVRASRRRVGAFRHVRGRGRCGDRGRAGPDRRPAALRARAAARALHRACASCRWVWRRSSPWPRRAARPCGLGSQRSSRCGAGSRTGRETTHGGA